MSGSNFPAVTAATAGALGILHVLLMIHVGMGRVKYKTGVGDGDNPILRRRLRMQGTLTETVALFLVMLGLLELSGAWPRLVMLLGPAMLVLSMCHTFGLSMRFGSTANAFRAFGAAGTALAMVILSAACLIVALPHLR